MRLADIPNKVTGIELIRRASNLFSNGSSNFADSFDTDQLLKIAQAYIACEWDFHPDKWEDQQVFDLLVYGKIPEWDDDEKPKYE
jgi:hypothetical protein